MTSVLITFLGGVIDGVGIIGGGGGGGGLGLTSIGVEFDVFWRFNNVLRLFGVRQVLDAIFFKLIAQLFVSFFS